MQKPIPLATWNPDRDLWETMDPPIFGPSDVWSATWTNSGMWANGVAYELPTWEPHTDASGSSSSPSEETLFLTPVASEGTKPSNTMGLDRRLTTGQVFLTNQIVSLCGLDPSEQEMPLLRTPAAAEAEGGALSPERAKVENRTLRLSGQMIDLVAPDQFDSSWKANPQKVGAIPPTPSTAGSNYVDQPLPMPKED